MERIEEIEAAVEELTPEEFRRFLQWIHERHHAYWEDQLDRDSAAGKLDSLFGEADGPLREWPPAK